MVVVARLADLVEDRQRIIQGLREHLNPLTDGRRFDWLYVDNPDGPARVWVLEDPEREELVGTTAALPRSLYVAGVRTPGCVIADTWVHPDYRALGPALKLQRACLTDISDERFHLGYDFPRQAMSAIYKRLRVAPRDELVELVKLLKLDHFLANRLGDKGAVRLLARAGNPLLRLAGLRIPGAGVEIELERGPCGPEFTALHEAQVGEGVCVARTADYLNWRYHRHFHRSHEFLVARRSGRLVGYVVFSEVHPRAVGVDLVCEDDEALRRALIGRLTAELTRRGCQSVQFPALASDPLARTLRAVGFRPMSAVPFVVLPAPDLAPKLADKRFSFTIGDEAD